MKRVLIVFMILFHQTVFSQNETSKWFFGSYTSIDFMSGLPVVGNSSMVTSEGSASVADASGNLLFYTNGVEVYDSSHTIMPNGTSLKGNISSTHTALIVPSPSNTDQYYLFTSDADGGPNGFCYSIVDMTLNSGYGDVTATKNIPLTDSVVEKVSAVKAANGIDYWIVTHKYGTSQFFAYKLTALGLEAPVISSVGTIHNALDFRHVFGQMKFNMCGDRLALALGYMDEVNVFDFNSITGIVSNPIILPMDDHVYGIEFSPSSQYLYVTCYDPTVSLSQFDVSLGNQALIQASESPVTSTDNLYGMQLGPDGKIYVSMSLSNNYLGVINSPDLPGFSCNYVDNVVFLDPNSNGNNGGLSLPSFMQSYLGNDPSCVAPSSVSEVTNSDFFSIYPNPSSEEFSFKFTKGNCDLEIIDVTGKIVLQEKNISNLNFGKNFSSGIYFAKIYFDGNVEVKKIVKE